MKKRREQREAEREAMAEELELIQRERAIAEAAELEKKEEEVGGCRRPERAWSGLCRGSERASAEAAELEEVGCCRSALVGFGGLAAGGAGVPGDATEAAELKAKEEVHGGCMEGRSMPHDAELGPRLGSGFGCA